MSFEYLIDPAKGPQWKGVLPGKPAPYVLRKGEGEHAMLFTDLFTVLLSGDETEGQFGIITADSPAGDIIPTHSHNETHETFYVARGQGAALLPGRARAASTPSCSNPGDFGFVPAGFAHAYKIEEAARMMGTLSGGFERFFQHMGTVDRPRHHGPAAVHPRLPAHAGRCPAAQHAVPARLRVAGRGVTATRSLRRGTPDRRAGRRHRLTVPTPPPRRRPRTTSRCRPPARRRRHPAAARRAVRRHPRHPAAGARPRPAPGAAVDRCRVVVFLHGGGWRVGSRHTVGPTYRAASGPFERVAPGRDRRRERRLPALRRGHLARAAARREGRRPLAACPRRRAGHRPRADRRLGRVGRRPPRRAARPDRRTTPRSRATSASTGPSSAVSAVVAWYAPATSPRSRPTSAPTRPTRRPGRRSCWAPRRRSVPRARRAGQPDHATCTPAPRRSCCCTARPTGSSRASRASGCTTALVDGRRRGRARRSTRARTTCGWGRPRPPRQALDRTIDFLRRQLAARPTKDDDDEDRGHPPASGGPVEVAALSDDGAQVTVVAGLEEFWADAAGFLSREPAGETAGRRRRGVRAAGAARAPG